MVDNLREAAAFVAGHARARQLEFKDEMCTGGYSSVSFSFLLGHKTIFLPVHDLIYFLLFSFLFLYFR